MTLEVSHRRVDVLLVEDSLEDVFLAREGFRQANAAVCIHHVDDGYKALAFLRKEGAYADAPTPALVLLDINMPGMSGAEVLASLGADQRLCNLPVVVLTTSANQADISRMYALGCKAYVVKPMGLDEIVQAFRRIHDFWLELNVPPAA